MVEYLKDHALVIEILGKQSDKNVPGGGRRNVPQAAPSDQTGYKNKADKLEAKLVNFVFAFERFYSHETETKKITFLIMIKHVSFFTLVKILSCLYRFS